MYDIYSNARPNIYFQNFLHVDFVREDVLRVNSILRLNAEREHFLLYRLAYGRIKQNWLAEEFIFHSNAIDNITTLNKESI